MSNWSTQWASRIKECSLIGDRTSPRGIPTLETLVFHARNYDVVDNWIWTPWRKLSATYAAAELLWYLSGSDDDRMVAYAPQYEKFLDGGVALGAYGRRWAENDQLRAVCSVLRKDPDSRRAVVTCWDASTDLDADARDVPCTLSLQFIRRGGQLHLHVSMRSNDLWLGFPYDTWCFSTVQKLIADELGLGYGVYYHTVGSAHVYESDVKKLGPMDTASYASRRHDPAGPGGATGYVLDDAVACEGAARTGDGDPMAYLERMPPHHVLTECAALCAAKFGYPAPDWLDRRLL